MDRICRIEETNAAYEGSVIDFEEYFEGKTTTELINLFYTRTNTNAFAVNDYFNFSIIPE